MAETGEKKGSLADHLEVLAKPGASEEELAKARARIYNEGVDRWQVERERLGDEPNSELDIESAIPKFNGKAWE